MCVKIKMLFIVQGRRGDFEISLVPKYEALSTGTTITLYSGLSLICKVQNGGVKLFNHWPHSG